MFTSTFGAVCKQSRILYREQRLSSLQRRSRCLEHRGFTTSSSGFGSFHTEDVEQLLRQNADEYVRPSLPFDFVNSSEYARFKEEVSTGDFAFGGPRARALFHLSPNWTFLNHGAFGGALKPISRLAHEWREYAEEQPLRFFDRVLFPHLVLSYRALAGFVNACPEDIVIVPNATTGLNCVLQSIPLRSGDGVLFFNTGYGSVKTMIAQVCCAKNAVAEEIQIQFPLESETELERVVQRKLEKRGNGMFRYLVVDHITSNTALRMPIMRLARLCESFGVSVIVDGAHGMLSCKLDMKEMREAGIQYYVSNCHKWLCAPKSSGFVWKNPDCGHLLTPRVISTGYAKGMLSSFM